MKLVIISVLISYVLGIAQAVRCEKADDSLWKRGNDHRMMTPVVYLTIWPLFVAIIIYVFLTKLIQLLDR